MFCAIFRPEAPEPSKPVKPIAAVKPFQSKIDYIGAMANKVLERDANTTNAGDVPPSRSQSLSHSGSSRQPAGGVPRSRAASLAGSGPGPSSVIDLTRSATPSPNRSQGPAAPALQGSHSNDDFTSSRDGAGSVASATNDHFGADVGKKKFKFKSKLSKSSTAPSKGRAF